MTDDKTPFEGVDEADDFEIDLGLAEDEADDNDLDLDFGDAGSAEQSDEVDLNFGADEPEADEEPVPAADEEQIVEQLRERLRFEPGDWYVIHTYSGMENRVKQNLDARVQTLGMEDYIFESIVPTEEAVEIGKSGAKKTVTRTILPGYVLVRMDLNDESWGAVRHTPSVTGFVAHASAPVPLSLDEVVKMLAPAEIAKATAAAGTPTTRKRKVEVVDFAVGDNVMVVQGPFAGVHASITEINANNQRIKALVEILGRETPVDLTFAQIQKD